MCMTYSGVSELYGSDDVGHGVLLVTALAYDSYFGWHITKNGCKMLQNDLWSSIF